MRPQSLTRGPKLRPTSPWCAITFASARGLI
jgi:hypothetical protein